MNERHASGRHVWHGICCITLQQLEHHTVQALSNRVLQVKGERTHRRLVHHSAFNNGSLRVCDKLPCKSGQHLLGCLLAAEEQLCSMQD